MKRKIMTAPGFLVTLRIGDKMIESNIPKPFKEPRDPKHLATSCETKSDFLFSGDETGFYKPTPFLLFNPRVPVSQLLAYCKINMPDFVYVIKLRYICTTLHHTFILLCCSVVQI